MADTLETDNNDKSPLLKPKKARPPPSEKQKENFKKMAEKRAENIKKRKEEKIIEAQKALLEKNGISIAPAKKEKLKENKPTIQFDSEESQEEEEVEEIPAPPISTPKATSKPRPPLKKQAKMKQIIEESETDYSSDSSEEVIVIKRGKKKTKAKPKVQQEYIEDVEEVEEEYVAKPTIDYSNYFC